MSFRRSPRLTQKDKGKTHQAEEGRVECTQTIDDIEHDPTFVDNNEQVSKVVVNTESSKYEKKIPRTTAVRKGLWISKKDKAAQIEASKKTMTMTTRKRSIVIHDEEHQNDESLEGSDNNEDEDYKFYGTESSSDSDTELVSENKVWLMSWVRISPYNLLLIIGNNKNSIILLMMTMMIVISPCFIGIEEYMRRRNLGRFN